MDTISIFCAIDDFCELFEPRWLLTTRFGQCSGISFIDSTKISVCHNRRIWSHKVFKALAKRGETCVDWFYGFKLHLVVNDCGELLAVKITAGNVDDPNPVLE